MGQALRKQENNYKKSEVTDGSEILEYLYLNKDDCYVQAFSKKTNKRKAYNINSLKEPNKLFQVVKRFGKDDLMFNLNPFRTMTKATQDNVFCINVLAIDIDYKKVKELEGLIPMQVLKLLEMDFFEQKIPMPNVVEYGNQLRLIYRLSESAYIPKSRDNLRILARRITEVFANELKDFGATKQNIETYFRFPSSINTKNNAEVHMLRYSDAMEYTIRELQELWLDELPKWYKRKNGKTKATNKIVKLHNVYALNTRRLQDLEKIQAYLKQEGINDFRARLCYLYRNFALLQRKYQNGKLTEDDFEYAKDEMLEFNNKFRYPLRANVIESSTRCLERNQYLYKNVTLRNFLDIDLELCEMLELESMAEIKNKQNRNKDYYGNKLKAEGKLTKQEKLITLREEIKNLKVQGIKNREIAKMLDVSIDKLKFHIKIMRK